MTYLALFSLAAVGALFALAFVVHRKRKSDDRRAYYDWDML